MITGGELYYLVLGNYRIKVHFCIGTSLDFRPRAEGPHVDSGTDPTVTWSKTQSNIALLLLLRASEPEHE